MNFYEMSDAEIMSTFSRIATQCDRFDNPAEECKRRIKDETGCPYTVAITYSKASLGMRMHMGMVHSPNRYGKTLSF